jgi:hypothetical protein
MKRLDDDKPSLVEFLGSIKFSHERGSSTLAGECREQIPHPRPLNNPKRHGEDAQLIRSAN